MARIVETCSGMKRHPTKRSYLQKDHNESNLKKSSKNSKQGCRWHMAIEGKRAVFIILPKKRDIQLCSNYRSITLISHASEILPKIMSCIKTKMDFEISNRQAGFWTGSGTQDHRWKNGKKEHKFTYMQICFMEYSEIFDCIQTNRVWKRMLHIGLSKNITSLIHSLYTGQQSAVRTELGMPEWLPILRGRQVTKRQCIRLCVTYSSTLGALQYYHSLYLQLM